MNEMTFSEKAHLVLGILGCIPALGAIPDLIDGVMYVCEGDTT